MEKVGEIVRPSGGRGRCLVLASLLLAAAVLLSLLAAASDAGAEEVKASLTPTEAGASRTLTFSSPGDHAALSVPVAAGESVSMVASEASVSGTYRLDWLNPKGEYVRTWYPSGEAGGFFEPIRFPEAGTATLLIDPEGTATGSITFTLYDASDRTGSISTAGGGETKTFTIAAPGQRQLVHFAGTEGQHVSLVPSNPDLEGEFHVNTPAGEWLEGSGGTLEGVHGPLTLPETGTYTVVLTGDGAQTGSVALGIHLPVVPPVGAAQGPVASYSFDEGEGTTVEDLTGDGHTATIHGAHWTTHGKYGGAMEFDGGEGEYLSVPDSPELDFSEEFTLEAWVRPSTVENFYAPVVDKLAGGGGHPSSFSYGLYAGDWEHHPFGEVENPLGSGRSVTAPEAIEARTWTHLALTFDGSEERLYVDGELVDETTAEAPVTTEGELEIGAETEHGDHYEGRIDELRIYGRALSPAQVGLDMETPLQTPKSGPVAAWSFDEGKGTSAADLTGHGHTATISKATWTRGRYGDGLKFDGKKSCVSVAASPELDFTEEFTLEAWVRPEGEGLDGIITQEDESAAEGEDPFAYTLLSGDEPEEGPRVWVRHPGGERGYAGGPPLPRNAWSHLAVTDDGAKLRFYVDGELTATRPAVPLTTAEGPLTFGCIALYGDHFKGRIDEVRVYDRAITTPEVDGDMEAPVQTPKTGPVAAYSFDEGSGETVEDITGDGHTATIQGAEWTTHGRYGGALEFHAEDEDFVSIPASPTLDGSEELTVEAWVRPTVTSEASILMKEREGSGPRYSYALYQYGEQAHGYFEESEEGALAPSENSLLPGVWTHLAITDDGAWSRLYVNGQLVDTSPALPLEGHGEIRLGGNAIWGEYFDGRIDEVRIYDRGLDAAEVDADMETPLQTPKSGPVAAYSFDEGEGSTVTDVTGHGHTATIEGAEWTEHGKYGGAMEFAGEDARLTVPDSPELDFTEEFTLEAWVRPGPASGEYGPLITKQTTGSRAQPYFLYEGSWDPNVPYGGTNENTEEEAHARAHDPLPVGTWSHVALTYDGRDVRLYVDGRLVDCEEASPPVSSEGDLEIGAASEVESYLDGRVDEVRIYGRALDDGEIQTDMEAPIQTPQRGPIAAWSFDEGEGTTAEDVTGDGHTGTVQGAEWVRGKYGDALRFDGPGDVVKVPNSPEFALTEAFTLEAWVRPESESNRWAPILAKEMGGGEAATELAWWLYESDWEADHPFGGTEPEPGEANYAASDDPLPVGAWSHVALTWDGSKVRLYVNGELVDCSPIAPAGAPPVTEGELQIGAATEHGDHFLGRIDEPRIYNRALTKAEIQASMKPLPEVGPAEPYGIEGTEAVMAATVNPRNQETTYKFQYGPTKRYGTVVPEDPEEVFIGNEPLEVEEVAEELLPETTYHYRVVAHSDAGTTVGPDQTLITGPEISEEEGEEAEFRTLAKKSWKGFFNLDWTGKRHEINSEINMVEKAGAETFRYAFDEDFAKTNEFFAAAASAEHPIRILPDLSFKRIEAKDPATETRTRWVNFVEESLKRYGDNGTFWASHPGLPKLVPEYWEIWNEENYGDNGDSEGHVDPVQFAELLKETHEAFERVDPGAKIMLGGLLTVSKEGQGAGHLSVGGFLHELNKAGGSPYYEAVSLHPYAFKGSVHGITMQVMRNISKARKALNHVGGQSKKIWVTEIGWPVDGPPGDELHLSVSQEKQKELLESVFQQMKSRSGSKGKGLGIEKAFYYNVQNNYYGEPKDWAMSCGLREDLSAVHVSDETVRGTPENGNYRKSWYAFQREAESPFLGKFP